MSYLRMRKGYKGVWFLPKNVAREFQNLKVVPELLRIYIQSTVSVHNCPIYNHPLYILSTDITFMHYALIIIQIELFAMNKPKICFELPTVHYDN